MRYLTAHGRRAVVMVAIGMALLIGTASLGWAVGKVGTDRKTIMASVTTNTTTTAVGVPFGPKSFYGQVVCTAGACTQTQALFGDIDDDATNGVLLCTVTLSGTPRAQDACPVMSANFSYYYVTTTNTTGTAASGSLYAMF